MTDTPTNGTNGSVDPTALRFRDPKPADEVIEQRIKLPEELRGQVMVVGLQGLIDWARRNAMWPVTFGLACCAIEYMAIQNSRFDLSRFGMEINRASPRQADIMIVSGTVTVKMAHAIRRIYDQMADPKYVISMGVCAPAGGAAAAADGGAAPRGAGAAAAGTAPAGAAAAPAPAAAGSGAAPAAAKP